jgi:hypothetical protein
MDIQQFQNHGWKATDKVVFKNEIYNVIGIDFVSIYNPIQIGNIYWNEWISISEIELYQPVHEAHTSLLTDIS